MEILPITTVEQAEQALSKPLAAILKHSKYCPVSARVKNIYDDFAALYNGPANLYQVNVIDARKVSDAIADRTGVRHESPQMIVIADGKPAWHASHYAITPEVLKEHLENP